MIPWVKELDRKLDSQAGPGYNRLKRLGEEKFQGNIRINFKSGQPVTVNLYDTLSL